MTANLLNLNIKIQTFQLTMNRLLFFAGLLLMASCQLLQNGEKATASLTDLRGFDNRFPLINWMPGDTLILPAFSLGTRPEDAGYDSTEILTEAELQEFMPAFLLDQASISPDAKLYPLASLGFAQSKKAYLLGVFEGFHAFHTQMFLFDSLQQEFTHTQSLHYLVGGGGFLSLRKAWMLDINEDAMPDLVYRKDELYRAPEPSHSYFLDTMRAEIWNGYHFVTFPLADQDLMKASFVMEDHQNSSFHLP